MPGRDRRNGTVQLRAPLRNAHRRRPGCRGNADRRRLGCAVPVREDELPANTATLVCIGLRISSGMVEGNRTWLRETGGRSMKIENQLAEYGLASVALVRMDGRRFTIEILNDEIAQLEKCIYAFVVGENVLRIGSSKARLRSRLKTWERDVSAAL